MFDPTDPQVLWLNVTNLLLAVPIVVCVLALGWAVTGDVRDALRRRRHGLEPHAADAHALATARLGLTMADGGVPAPRGSNGRSPRGESRGDGSRAKD